MLKRDVLNSPRLLELKKKRRQVFQNKVFFSVFLLAFLFVLTVYISGIPRMNIQNIEIKGVKILDPAVLRGQVAERIAGKYFWFFPQSNIFLYPKNAIASTLSSKFKRIKEVRISLQNRNDLLVSIIERLGLYTWCGDSGTPELSSESSGVPLERCYFLDEDGYIFDEAPYFSGDVYFKFYGPAQSGSHFLGENFKQLLLFKQNLERMQLVPVAFRVVENQEAKMLLSSAKETAPEIIFKLSSDYQKIIENLQAALQAEPLQSKFKNKYSSLIYIDLRFDNKVYYKFR